MHPTKFCYRNTMRNVRSDATIQNNGKEESYMASPIKETPVLWGEDARRFEEEMRRVDNLSAEERKAYREKLRKQCEEFRRKVIIKI